ncbi:MAG: tRNA (adenosine(37)-N6)-threonylcarbamoyltransferase complex dimerization subunit type 1 TsaB [Bacteroidales bacterium]|nr:tRNA (adenosine(37)-N6)-threonylcarbamoyltransferase complex dimerization subunit type 1 TsaB [Bacteroidales bacterium]
MAVILNIETSTRVCSVGLAVDGIITSLKETHVANSHAELITMYAEQAINEAGYSFVNIDAVAISMGPGSYTGLRIGVSTAKGFCYALDKPLIAIDTLKAMAAGMINQVEVDNFLVCPMIDARRMEVYTAIYDQQLQCISQTDARIIDADSFRDELNDHQVYFGGDGAAKCEDVLGHQSKANFMVSFHPSARYMAALSDKKFRANQFEDVAYFEPYYLKDFVAGIPKVKGLKS